MLPLEVMANRLPWMSVLVVGIASLHCNGSAGTSSGIGAASTPDASVGGGAAPPFAPEDDEASSSPDASYDVGSPDDAPDARLDASPDAMTDAPFTAPADASTDAALDEDPPPWDGAAPTLRGPYEGWANWPMPNPPSLGLPNPQSYDTSTPGVVRDNVTGLEWQAQSFDDGQYGILSWGQAGAYCQGLTVAGQSDWRVPSRIELVSLYDSTRTSPALNPVFLQPAAYSPGVGESDWTSTLAVANPSTAWTGALYWEDVGTITATSATAYTRCVRGGPATDVLPPTRYQVAAGTVYDTMTRLTWQRADSGGQLDWSDASTYCATWPPARPSCAACDDDATVHRAHPSSGRQPAMPIMPAKLAA